MLLYFPSSLDILMVCIPSLSTSMQLFNWSSINKSIFSFLHTLPFSLAFIINLSYYILNFCYCIIYIYSYFHYFTFNFCYISYSLISQFFNPLYKNIPSFIPSKYPLNAFDTPLCATINTLSYN